MPDLIEDVARRWKSFARNTPFARRTIRPSKIDAGSVVSAYARWAPIYDRLFGAAFEGGRRATVDYANALPDGRVLECGVGTGISLPFYKNGHRITGIDLSPDMLALAEQRVRRRHLATVEALTVADAGALNFLDGSFDASVAMFVITVVPDPAAVMRELARVTRPGGTVVLVSHFAGAKGPRKWLEDRMAPFSAALGWHTDFAIERILGRPELKLIARRPVGPLGFFTLVAFERIATRATPNPVT